MKSLFLMMVLLGGCAPTPTPVATPEPAPAVVEAPQKAEGTNPKRLYQLKDLKTATLEVNGKKLKAWIMDTDSKRMEGMMFLTNAEVKADEAMLFVFPEEEPRSFWMRNTLIDLDIAYITGLGKIVSTHRMKSLDETGVPSAGPAMFALEMKAGAFQRLGIKKGQTVKIPSSVKAIE